MDLATSLSPAGVNELQRYNVKAHTSSLMLTRSQISLKVYKELTTPKDDWEVQDSDQPSRQPVATAVCISPVNQSGHTPHITRYQNPHGLINSYPQFSCY